jgi:hypothetical protein
MSLNTAQELFAIFFAIFYGLMLGYAQEYNPFDTYDAWRRKRSAIKRLLTALLILNFIPFLHFAIVFIILGKLEIFLGATISDVLKIVLVPFLSLFGHGYYRIFTAFLYRFPKAFYTSKKRIQQLTKAPTVFLARFVPGLLYAFLPTLILLVIVYSQL